MKISYGIGDMTRTYTVNPKTGRIVDHYEHDSSLPNLYDFLMFEEESNCLYFRLLEKEHNTLVSEIGFAEALALVMM